MNKANEEVILTLNDTSCGCCCGLLLSSCFKFACKGVDIVVCSLSLFLSIISSLVHLVTLNTHTHTHTHTHVQYFIEARWVIIEILA